MKRLFIAVKIVQTPNLSGFINKVKDYFKNENIKWVETNNLHLTLRFLGDTEETTIHQISESIQLVSSSYKRTNFQIIGTGIFKNINYPTALWLGLNNTEQLTEIKLELYKILIKNNIKLNLEPFKPHLTIGRPKFMSDKKRLRDFLKNTENQIIDTQSLNKIALYESLLTPSGPIYKPLFESEINS